MHSLNDPLVIARRLHLLNAAAEALITVNSVLPIASLSQDVLLMIFQILVDDEFLTTGHPRVGGAPYKTKGQHLTPSWITITHVYKHWRSICLASPALWTKISSDLSPTSRDVFLERSQAAPLSFHLVHPNRKGTEFWDVAWRYFERVDRLTLALGTPIPREPDGSVKRNVVRHLRFVPDEFYTTDLSRTLATAFPHLATLEISHYSGLAFTNWAFPRTLTCLCINGNTCDIFASPGLFNALKELHDLRKLQMKGGSYLQLDDEDSNVQRHGTIHLRLRYGFVSFEERNITIPRGFHFSSRLSR